jgi:riboflavin transporter FmnP
LAVSIISHEGKSRSAMLSALAIIASLISVAMLVATAFGVLPVWSVVLVPVWVGYLNMDLIVGLARPD